jgi:hypothetical protein
MLASAREFQIADPEQNTSQILEGDCRGQEICPMRDLVFVRRWPGASGISTGLVFCADASRYI